LEAPSAYAAACFGQYGLVTDQSGKFTAMYKPYHLIGLELSISVLSAALRGEPTGQPRAFRGDVVAVAKRDLAAGKTLDGEGGYTVWGKLVPAAKSMEMGALPIGMADRGRLTRAVGAGEIVRLDGVEGIDSQSLEMRRAMKERADLNQAELSLFFRRTSL